MLDPFQICGQHDSPLIQPRLALGVVHNVSERLRYIALPRWPSAHRLGMTTAFEIDEHQR